MCYYFPGGNHTTYLDGGRHNEESTCTYPCGSFCPLPSGLRRWHDNGKMLENATEMDPYYRQDIADGAKANKAKLLNDYKGKIVTNTSILVSSITESGIVTLGGATVKTYGKLTNDEVEQFEVGDLIVVRRANTERAVLGIWIVI